MWRVRTFVYQHVFCDICVAISNDENLSFWIFLSDINTAQSSGAVEHPDCIFTEGVGTRPQRVSRYDTKPSYREAPVLELWGMWTTPSGSLFPGPLKHGVGEHTWVQWNYLII